MKSSILIISIHAAREGGDYVSKIKSSGANIISIHAAREGGDQRVSLCSRKARQFQSTPPVKAATIAERQHRN